MNHALHLRRLLAIGVSSAALIGAAPALAQTAPAGGAPEAKPATTTVGEIIVTAERREESLQSTPVAVSAFNEAKLKVQRLDGGQNLEISIPNVNYSRENFGGYDFSIRGVGTKTVGAGGTAGVSVNENELPVAENHFADSDFYDMQRVEVLRGPQGTLYGRNSTGGAVNLITNQPTDTFGGSLSLEYGNYNDRKATGFINIPFNDVFQLRVAGDGLLRDGFGTNLYTGDKIDGRRLGSGRITLAFKPNDKFSAYLMYEHYGENDSRNRVGKQLCITDPDVTKLANGAPVTSAASAAFLNQGCLPGSLYQNAAYGTLNTNGTLAGVLTNLAGLTSYNNLDGNNPLQDHNLHDIASMIDPLYTASEDLAMLHMSWNITDDLTLQSITGFNRNVGTSAEDYNRIISEIPFNKTPNPSSALAAGYGALYTALYSALFPNGYVSDPQIGTTNRDATFDYGTTKTTEITQELRLSSSFKGPVNFSVGLYYTDNQSPQLATNYDVESTGLTAFSQINDGIYNYFYANTPGSAAVKAATASAYAPLGGYVPIGTGYPPNGSGHNYYDATFGGDLKSYAAFGEVYWNVTPDIKITGGVRFTDDKLVNTAYPIELLVGNGVAGFPSSNTPCTAAFLSIPGNTAADCVIDQSSDTKAVTGRLNIDWTPTLSFTDKTLVYASYSRGYKGGGFNTPCQAGLGEAGASTCGYSFTFLPEYIDAFEVGTKNTLGGGTITLNADAFYYNYSNYQVSQIIAESSVNENFNAKIYGVEFEGVWSPIRNLVFNANVGYLHTEITGGTDIDSLNVTNSNPAYTLVKTSSGANCIVDTAGLSALVNGPLGGAGLTKLCQFALNPGVTLASGETLSSNAAVAQGQIAQANYLAFLTPYVGAPTALALAGNGTTSPGALFNYSGLCTIGGCAQPLKGKQLPNAPEFTLSIGAQYTWELQDDWKVTLRGDYYWQDSSYARVFNAVNDQLESWSNVNMTLNIVKTDWGFTTQLWVKNLTNAQPITDTYVTDPTSGLFENTFTLDPRTYGVTLTKTF
jgi:outer membrane receptor protein involved in Fe transport